MSTYARVNSLTKKVDRIIEAESLFFDDRADYDLWIKTSRELTKKSAAEGDTYNADSSYFKDDSPHVSWVFNTSLWIWEPPTAMPNQTGIEVYDWDEASTNWVERE
jgi:hypothetical protein